MSLTLKWDNHNRIAQSDIPVAYDDGDTGLETGQKTVIEWRFRADPGDAWGEPTIQTISLPATTTYDPPGDGWVEITAYSIRDGVTSRYSQQGVVPVEGGAIRDPLRYVDENANPYVDEDGNTYYDA